MSLLRELLAGMPSGSAKNLRGLITIVRATHHGRGHESGLGALRDVDQRMRTCKALIHEEVGWQRKAEVLALKLSADDPKPVQLKKDWDTDTVAGRLALAFAFLPSDFGEAAGRDFAERLMDVFIGTLGPMTITPNSEQGMHLPQIITELRDMTSLLKSINAFARGMTLLGQSEPAVAKLLTDNAGRAFDHMAAGTSLMLVQLEITPLSELTEHIEHIEQAARDEPDLSAEGESDSESPDFVEIPQGPSLPAQPSLYVDVPGPPPEPDDQVDAPTPPPTRKPTSHHCA